MGFLEVGTPLSWEDSAAVREYVKTRGLMQFLHLWNMNKNRRDEELRWGEEVEYSLVDINSDRSSSRIFVEASEILEELTVREHIRSRPPTQLSCDWHPEFANHMIEAIPSPPYPLNLNSILMLEPSMRLRRAKIQSILPSEKFVTSQTAFPRFGLDDFMTPLRGSGVDPVNSITRSVFIPDELLNPHPRFGTLVNNIRSRRGAKPVITIPVFRDSQTFCASDSSEADWTQSRDAGDLDRFSVEQLALQTINPIKDQIYMDCFAFGMGMSCVQTTFATNDITAARYLYDQLTVLAPLFLALSASTPVLRGLLSDSDTRWSTLEQAVDCRTEEEMATIPKSRYSGVSLYISDCDVLKENREFYNDTKAPINEAAKQLLLEHGVDDILASHYGHLWIRDPMVIFAEKVELDDTKAVDHFENIQSTNWNSIRFKPPPPSTDGLSPIGWRVEFRTPENQLTDLDNAAGVALISVIAQMIMARGLDLYTPMSLNDANMNRSWERDAVNQQKFFFRKNISKESSDREIVEMSLDEILSGSSEHGFEGLIPMCNEFMAGEMAAGRCGAETRQRFHQYCTLLQKRAAGHLMTSAQFIRRFVTSHPAYKQDSIVNATISHDVTVLSANIGFGVWASHDLHGDLAAYIPQTPLPASVSLPAFSETAAVRFTDISSGSIDNNEAETSPIHLLKKRMVVLNKIESIYTMPVGVTTRFGALGSAFSPPLGRVSSEQKFQGGTDLFDLACGELIRVNHNCVDKKRGGKNQGAVSSEDFTRSWLTKGFDLVGHGPVEKTARFNLLRQLKVCASCVRESGESPAGSPGSTVDSSPTCSCGSSTTLQQLLLRHKKKTASSGDMHEHLSTVCPSSTEGGFDCEIGDDLMHELSRSLNLGFDSEEELEYFKQVCDTSA